MTCGGNSVFLRILKPDLLTFVQLHKAMAFQPTKTGGANCLYKLVLIAISSESFSFSVKVISSLSSEDKEWRSLLLAVEEPLQRKDTVALSASPRCPSSNNSEQISSSKQENFCGVCFKMPLHECGTLYDPVWIASSSSQRPLKSSAWIGQPQKSPSAAVLMNGICQGAGSEAPIRDQDHSLPKFMMNKLSRGVSPTLLKSVRLHWLPLMVLSKRAMRSSLLLKRLSLAPCT